MIGAPGPKRLVGLDREPMLEAGGNRRGPAEAAHLNWDAAVGGRAVTQLPGGVHAPGPDRAVGLEDQAEVAAPGDRGDAAQAADLDRHGATRRGARERRAISRGRGAQ